MKRVPFKVFNTNVSDLHFCQFCCLSGRICDLACIRHKDLHQYFYYPEIFIEDHE